MTPGSSPRYPLGPLPATERFVASQEAIVRYAGASGDFTRIHYEPAAAAEAGYDRIFAMGMLTAGHLGTLLVRSFGEGAVREMRTRFRDRCWLDETVTCTGSVRDVDPDGTVVVDLRAMGEDGRTIVDGHARVHPTA